MDMYQKRKKRQEMKITKIKKNTEPNEYQLVPRPHGQNQKTNNRRLKISRPSSRSIRCKNTNFKSKSRYPRIHKNKNKIEVLNKADLADDTQTANWVKYFEKNNIPAVITDSNSGKGIREVIKNPYCIC